MKYKLLVRPEAEAELEEAYVWYEQQVAGLGIGSQFLLAVDVVIHAIRINPLQYPIAHKDVRRALTLKFPFQIFFVMHDTQIVIISVFHGMRDPSVWQSRN